MKKLFCLLMILLATSGIQAQTWTQQYPSFVWGQNNIYCAHDETGSSYFSRKQLLHCDNTGDTMWSKSYTDVTETLGLLQLDNGNIVVAFNKEDGYDTAGNSNVITAFVTYDNDGNELSYDSTMYTVGYPVYATLNALFPDNAGGYYKAFTHAEDSELVIIQRMDGNGNLLWQRSILSVSDDIVVPLGVDSNGRFTLLLDKTYGTYSTCRILTVDTGNSVISDVPVSNRIAQILREGVWEWRNTAFHLRNGDEIITDYDYNVPYGTPADHYIYRVSPDGSIDSSEISSFATLMNVGTEMPDHSFIFFYQKYSSAAACEQGFVRLDNNFNFVESWPDPETDTVRLRTFIFPNNLNGVFYAAYSGIDFTSMILNASQLDSAFKTTPASVNDLPFSNGAVIYPNPSNGTFHVDLPASPACWTVTATDASGRQVWNKTLNGNNEIEASLPPGIYFIAITNTATGRSHVRKLVIQ